VRQRIAEMRVALGRPADAIDSYLAALDDLQSAKAAAARKVALDLMKLALLQETQDPRVSPAVANTGLTAATIWEALRREMEGRLKAETMASAVQALGGLLAEPVIPLDPETLRNIDVVNRRALELQSQFDGQRVQSSLTRLRETPNDEAARGAIL